MNLINCKNLSFNYNNAKCSTHIETAYDKPLLENVSFEVNSGDFILLCGSIGSGKTTLLKLLKKEISPKGTISGELIINVDSHKIGYVFQIPDNQIVCQTPYEEIAFGMANHNYSTIKIKQQIAEWSAFFDLENLLHQDIMTLSGGEKQRVNIAAIMAMKPDIILLDEPTSMLDPVSVVALSNILKRLQEEFGTTIILCEHNLEPFIKSADKILYLDDKSYFGKPDEIMDIMAKSDYSAYMLPASFLAEKGYNKATTKDTTEMTSGTTLAATENLPSDTPSITIKKLSFAYPEQEYDLLKSVNLQVTKGSCQIIAGSNGCGKSTLFKLILKVLKASSGKIKTEGKIVYLPQNPITLFAKDTVGDDLNYYFNNIGSKKVENLILESSLAHYPLFEIIKDLWHMNPLDLSGGQLSLVAIFKVLLAEPDILLLDEPSKSLDSKSTVILAELIRDLCAKGKTVVIITHNMEFASMCGDRICLLFDGEIIENTSIHDFITGSSFYTTKSARLTDGRFLNRRDIIEHGNFDFV